MKETYSVKRPKGSELPPFDNRAEHDSVIRDLEDTELYSLGETQYLLQISRVSLWRQIGQYHNIASCKRKNKKYISGKSIKNYYFSNY